MEGSGEVVMGRERSEGRKGREGAVRGKREMKMRRDREVSCGEGKGGREMR